jgi:hypothetical protein
VHERGRHCRAFKMGGRREEPQAREERRVLLKRNSTVLAGSLHWAEENGSNKLHPVAQASHAPSPAGRSVLEEGRRPGTCSGGPATRGKSLPGRVSDLRGVSEV